MPIDIRTKAALFSCLMAWVLAFNDPLMQLVVLLILSLCVLLGKISVRKVLASLIPLMPVFVVIGLFSGLFGYHNCSNPLGDEELFSFGEQIRVKKQAAILAGSYILRFINVVTATKIFLERTSPDDFFQMCRKFRLPASLTFMITTAVRFIPELSRKKEAITDAQRCRGKSLKRSTRAEITLMVPLIINSIILAENLTLALLNRAFGLTNGMTDLCDIQLRGCDRILIAISVVATIACFVVRFTSKWLYC